MSVRRSDKQTLGVIIGHTLGIVKADSQRWQKSTLTAYCIANIFPHKKNNV